jgi:hypothetical protein
VRALRSALVSGTNSQFTYEGKRMFLGLGLVLLLLWLGGFFVFHVTAFFIHILLILAVVSVVFHFMRGAASSV